MLIATPLDANRPVKAVLVNCEPWSVLNTSGRPKLSASSSASRQKSQSKLFDIVAGSRSVKRGVVLAFDHPRLPQRQGSLGRATC